MHLLECARQVAVVALGHGDEAAEAAVVDDDEALPRTRAGSERVGCVLGDCLAQCVVLGHGFERLGGNQDQWLASGDNVVAQGLAGFGHMGVNGDGLCHDGIL